MPPPISLVKVFSVTRAADRERIGERITDWLQATPGVRVVRAHVLQSSDRTFHCLSFVFLCERDPG